MSAEYCAIIRKQWMMHLHGKVSRNILHKSIIVIALLDYFAALSRLCFWHFVICNLVYEFVLSSRTTTCFVDWSMLCHVTFGEVDSHIGLTNCHVWQFVRPNRYLYTFKITLLKQWRVIVILWSNWLQLQLLWVCSITSSLQLQLRFKINTLITITTKAN